METTTKPQWFLPIDKSVLGFALLRLAIILSLVYYNFPPLVSGYRFYFHHGGDQEYYFQYGRMLARGTFEKIFSINMGHPALMAIGIRFWGAESFDDLATYMTLVTGFLFGCLSIFVIGRLALEWTGNRRAAVLAAGVWAAMPVLLWLVLWPYPNGEWLQAPHVPGIAWLNGGVPDGSATFFALLALYFLTRTLENNRKHHAILTGVSLGVMITFKIHIALVIALVFLVLALKRQWVSGLWTGFGFVLGYFPQVISNYMTKMVVAPNSLINPWLPGYLYFGAIDANTGRIGSQLSPISLNSLVTNLAAIINRFGMIGIVILFIGIILLALSLYVFWLTGKRIGWHYTTLMLGAAPAASGIHLFSAYMLEDPPRFFLPAAPFLAILGAWIVVYTWDYILERRQHKRQIMQSETA